MAVAFALISTVCLGADVENAVKPKRQIPVDNNADVLSWGGKILQGLEKSEKIVAVEPDSTVKVNVFWRNVKSSPGSDATPAIIFESADGTPLAKQGDVSPHGWNLAIFGNGTMVEKCFLYPMTTQYPSLQSRDVMESECYYIVPKGAVQARLAFIFKGNPISIQHVDFKVEKVSAPPAVKPLANCPTLTHEGELLTDSELDKMLERSETLVTKLKTKGDRVSMYVNGKLTAPTIYKTSALRKDKCYDMMQTFHKAGFNIFTIEFSLGLAHYWGAPCEIWKGPKQIDIGELRESIRQALKRSPESMIMLECMVSPYRGWGKENPDEVFQHEDGRKGLYKGVRIRNLSSDAPVEAAKGIQGEFWHPSYYSEKYNAEVAEAIHDLFLKLESIPEGKKIIGVYLNGGTDGQWLDLFDTSYVKSVQLAADYSPAALKAFRGYLKDKYGNDIAKLRSAWKDDSVKSFDEVTVPSVNEMWRKDKNFHSMYESCKTSAYCEFLGYGNAMRHIKWCKAVKEATRNRILTGGYAPHAGVYGYPILSRQSTKWLLESKYVDFFAIVPGYLREYYDPIILAVYNGSLLLHNKLVINELDLRSPEVPHWGKWASEFWRRTHNAETYRKEVEKFAAYSIGLGGTFHAYDMESGWFNTPSAIDAWKKACEIAKQASPGRLDDKRIAVAASERFWDFQSFAGQRLFVYSVREFPQYAFARSGVKSDNYLLSDVLDNKAFEAPKVLMFADACTMTPEQADSVREKFGNSGRVLVWFWAPGIFAPGDEKNHSKICGFTLERSSQADGKPIFAALQHDPLLIGVEGFLFPWIPSYDVTFGSAWKVADPEAKILANYFETDIPAMAVKRHKDFTEIYIGQPGSLTPQFVRNIAMSAGIIPLCDTDDIVGCGGNILYLVALSSGVKTLNLPEGSGVVECLTGQNLVQAGNGVTVYVPVGDTLVLRMNQKPEVSRSNWFSSRR